MGYGELCGSFQIFIPLGDHANSWLTQYYNWRNWFDEILDAEVVLQEVAMASDGSKSLFEYAVPFAISQEKDLLFWDTCLSDCTENTRSILLIQITGIIRRPVVMLLTAIDLILLDTEHTK